MFSQTVKDLREAYLCGYWTYGQLREVLHLSDKAVDEITLAICQGVECPLVKKPRMLFLDDRAKRVDSARRQFGEKWDLTVVSNAKECLRKMSEEDWEEIHLDHDLNGDDFQDPDEPTAGMAIVRYIEKCGGWPGGKRKPIFVIHSSNIFAACLMVSHLNDLGLYARWERFIYDEETQ